MSSKLLEKKERERVYALHQKRIAEARRGRPNRTPLSVNASSSSAAAPSSSTSRKADPRSPRTSARLAAAQRVSAARRAARDGTEARDMPKRPTTSGNPARRGARGGAIAAAAALDRADRPRSASSPSRSAADLGEAERAYDEGLGIRERPGLSKEEKEAQARRRADARRLYARRLRTKVRAKVLELSVMEEEEEEEEEKEEKETEEKEGAMEEEEEEEDVDMAEAGADDDDEDEVVVEEEDDGEEEEVVVASLASSVKELTSLLGASKMADSEREELEGLAARLLEMEKEAQAADADLEASLQAADAAMNRLSSYNFKSPTTVSKASRVAQAAPRGKRYSFKPPQ